MKITLKGELTDGLVANLSIEVPGAISYWGSVRGMCQVNGSHELTFTIAEDDTPTSNEYRELGPGWIVQGLEGLWKLDSPAMGRIMRGDYDKWDVDLLVQAALFGKLKYG